MGTPTQVALWYLYYDAPAFDLCDSEREAAEDAVRKVENAAGVPLGIQFPDGRTVAAADWPEYHAAERREQERARHALSDAGARSRPTRKIRDPFRDREIEIDADEPAWIGR